MADSFLQLSCIFHVGSPENVTRAFDIRGEMAAELHRQEGCDIGFEMETDHEYGSAALWTYSDGFGEPLHVIAFVLRCAEAFDLTRLWGFH